jgi:mono/diheme cytochrome c family protein
MRNRMRACVILALGLGAGLAGCGDGAPREVVPRLGRALPPAHDIDPLGAPAPDDAFFGRAAALYERQCAPCHGASGEGDGPAAHLLHPKPRNLVKARFRFVSTWEGAPTDDDLYRVISRGIPGSAMPAWSWLPERDRWALVHFVKGLAKKPIRVAAGDPGPPGDVGKGVLAPPPEPADDAASRHRGAKLFQENCKPCHGERGRGDGPQASSMKDEEGLPIRPRNLGTGVFKSDPRPEHLFRRVVLGIPGTPMPMTPTFKGGDGWHLVHYVRSLSSDRLRERAELSRRRLAVVPVDPLPDHPDSGGWRAIAGTELHLMPLWWRHDRPELVTVQAASDGRSLGLLLVWADDSHDARIVRSQDFRDAAAVQIAPAGDDPPFFAMGERNRSVEIWMWKSERQADLSRFQDLESEYPNIGIDSYPNLQHKPHEQPVRSAFTPESDRAFITAWGAGNVVVDPTRSSAAEDLMAKGFGTLRARADQLVAARGVHASGSYRVMFTRALQAAGRVELSRGAIVPVAFAIWNGDAGDRAGQKSVTIWHELDLAAMGRAP